MDIEKKINAFAKLGEILSAENNSLEEVLHETGINNPWFTKFHCELMVKSFIEKYFNKNNIEKWLNKYEMFPEKNKSVGLILAGNIPFVGMHDILCVLMSGNIAKVKLSSKDEFFFPWLHKKLIEIEPEFSDKILFADKLENFDAVIATGSNNSARYFEYYFGKYPNIIRKNRTSIAIINGDESEGELHELGKDIFYYFGLGCRNVSKLYLPENFEPEKLFRIWEDFNYVIDNNKYKNNYDYNRTLLLLNQTQHLSNDFFMMEENEKLFSPLAVIYYEYYSDEINLQKKINSTKDDIQCVVSNSGENIKFGQTQFPELWDYADGVDTMEFLGQLAN